MLIHNNFIGRVLLNLFTGSLEDDYSLGNDSVDQILILSSADLNDTITITILDDDINECEETVSIELDFLKGELPRVDLSPSSMKIVIMDDDKSK